MMITSIKKEFNQEKLVPMIHFTGQLSVEFLEDTKITLTQTELYNFVGELLINGINDKMKEV